MALCVFAPDSYFDFNEEQDRDPTTIDFSTFDEEIYRISPWPRLNGLANGVPIDVRLIPDLKNLLPDKETQTFQFKNFEAALDQVVTEFQRHFAA